ncbi:MAG: GH92 family glycosyl hydrolase [Planctomycetales bacterium]|nr:GH92 family glycosyl hydrolase [Planctomycetales bacterium]
MIGITVHRLRNLTALLVGAILALGIGIGAYAAEPADEVNTLQGTNSRFELTRGNTYPTVAMPWGMHTWTPQTGPNGDGWKYQYHKDAIRGFQQAHQCSSWSNDYNVFSLMPVVGKLTVDEHRRAAGFRHADEVAKPYFYSVQLANGVAVEIAPTDHGAMLRFAFPPEGPAYLVLDGYTGECELEIQPDQRRIVGRIRNGRNLPRELSNHFVAAFDQPIKSAGTWRQRRRGAPAISSETSIAGRRAGAYLEFAPGATVNVRVASSYIDPAQAELNLRRELEPVENLAAVAAAAKARWNETLGRVEVEGGTAEQRRTFYSCLFRASLFPRKFFEFDAADQPYYRSPYDGQVHRGYMYTDTGLWDTFRAQLPLNSLLQPTMYDRYVQAMLDAYDQCGWLPSWSFPGEAGSMIGNHAISVLADAWAKGYRGFDAAHAVAAYDHETRGKGPWGPANGRGGWDEIERLGYLPSPHHREATAKTLEYAYDDFCGYALAQATGQEEYAAKFADRMFNYRNVFDRETGFMRGKDAAGRWTEPFDPAEWGGPYTEGCAWHWNWSVFHDVAGLMELLGGEEAFVAKLDEVFAAPSDFGVGTYGAPIHEMREMVLAEMGQYAHGNQPIQHMAYLYNYAGQPWKSQYWVRQIMARLYSSDENGYPGDEDQGQTSSWYVLSALGFYSVCPGTAEYVLGSPIFERASITVGAGRRFTVHAKNNSAENVYIQSATLNGAPLTRNYLRHEEIAAGGELVLEMGPAPNRDRGVALADRPFSVSTASPGK